MTFSGISRELLVLGQYTMPARDVGKLHEETYPHTVISKRNSPDVGLGGRC